MSGRFADEPHHDGSPAYTTPGIRRLGDQVRLHVRVPEANGVTRVRLRSVPDAEPRVVDAVRRSHEHGAVWWSVDLVLHNPLTNYRFLLEGGSLGRCWLTGAGVFHRDVTDDGDFRIGVAPDPPSWLTDAIGYQVFIDRFANSGAQHSAPDWAISAAWDTPVETGPGRSQQWYGGDLPGVEQHLDHLARLGVTLIYLTPFFPARSMHRYDASSFDHVDPVLGGDGALASLTAAAHDRGIRVIGDITLNHTGDHHEWFLTASSDVDALTRDFYHFDESEPYGYVAWHGVPTLPKLDHRSARLRARLYDGADSVVAHHLAAPFELDGWRVDCANTSGRFRDIDVNLEIATTTRATMASSGTGLDEHWLVAEHCYDAGADLTGAGWHGVMDYEWFGRPVWGWLKAPGPMSLMSAVDLIEVDGIAMVESMRHLAANVPWTARQASMSVLDSHDTARFRTVVGGDPVRHLVGLTALLTLPGIPTIFAGSEIGLEGDNADSARVPFPWDSFDPDDEFLQQVGHLIELRRTHAALQHGGLRWIDATPESVTFVRETDDDDVLVHLVRTPTADRAFTFDEIGVGPEFRLTAAVGFGSRGDDDDHVLDPTEHRLVLGGAPGATVLAFSRR